MELVTIIFQSFHISINSFKVFISLLIFQSFHLSIYFFSSNFSPLYWWSRTLREHPCSGTPAPLEVFPEQKHNLLKPLWLENCKTLTYLFTFSVIESFFRNQCVFWLFQGGSITLNQSLFDFFSLKTGVVLLGTFVTKICPKIDKYQVWLGSRRVIEKRQWNIFHLLCHCQFPINPHYLKAILILFVF